MKAQAHVVLAQLALRTATAPLLAVVRALAPLTDWTQCHTAACHGSALNPKRARQP